MAVSWVNVSFRVREPDWAWGPGGGLASQGKEESVLKVQLAVSSFGGTNIESKQ